jgi:hypothetical protein
MNYYYKLDIIEACEREDEGRGNRLNNNPGCVTGRIDNILVPGRLSYLYLMETRHHRDRLMTSLLEWLLYLLSYLL